MLAVFGGLPGTCKTTVVRAVAARCRAAYIRVDAIEQAMRSAGVLADGKVGPAGYMAAYALAEANLRLGLAAVADCVNPVRETRRLAEGRRPGTGPGNRTGLLGRRRAQALRRNPRLRPARLGPAHLGGGDAP